jgi:hypothetical protein
MVIGSNVDFVHTKSTQPTSEPLGIEEMLYGFVPVTVQLLAVGVIVQLPVASSPFSYIVSALFVAGAYVNTVPSFNAGKDVTNVVNIAVTPIP